MYQIFTIAKKEFKDAIKNKVFLTFLVFLLGLTSISIYVGALDFQSKVATYSQAFNALVQSGQHVANLEKPQFFPLQLLRGTIEYLEVIGAILAIALGYLTIAREKGRQTMQLILTRPIKRSHIIIGKLLGGAVIILSVTTLTFLLIAGIVTVIGGAHLTIVEVQKMLLAYISSSVYLFIFFLIAAILTLLISSLPNALIVSFVLWIVFVLIVPQIGDTMDTDNQVPGGFFNAINVTNAQSKIILQKFTTYETIRNGIEEVSLTKHYERLTFALLGIKDIYNQKPIGYILQDKFNETIWLSSYLFVLSYVSIQSFTKSRKLVKNEV